MTARRIEIFADGADLETMARIQPSVSGFTTNPSILRKAGVKDYREFAREVLAIAVGKPVSFEVLADDFETMERQAREIASWASWGNNVFVKIPITNAAGVFTGPVISSLTERGRIKVNVTAVFTAAQARAAADAMRGEGNIISVFAGRIADAGVSPARTVLESVMSARRVGARVLWASARQVYSVIEAEKVGADIITLTPDLIAKLPMFGRDLGEYSLETVRQFAKDAEGIAL